MRRKASFCLKILTVALVLFGVLLNFLAAEADGYSHWSKRLLYFTTQSNLWIGLTFLALLFWKDRPRLKYSLYLLKYVFTVSITVTCIIFCFVLAPGAGNDNYNAWTPASLIVHVFVPCLSIADFFVDAERIQLQRRCILFTAIPPFLYMIFSSILGFMNVDFGRGDAYPYFFLNYRSPAGFFGFSDQMPYIVGSFYWMLFILLIIFSLGWLYRRLYAKKTKE